MEWCRRLRSGGLLQRRQVGYLFGFDRQPKRTDSNAGRPQPPPLPPYTLRESSRARYFRIKVSARKGVEVIVPLRFDRRRIPSLLEEKREWIAEAVRKVETQQRAADAEARAGLPRRISLRALEEEWAVEYRATDSPWVMATESEGGAGPRLIVKGHIEDEDACRQALRRWVFRKAHACLVPWLEAVARAEGLPFRGSAVKAQRTRWGSCSAQGIINLNSKLLFVPSALVHYLLLHELCHTLHFNHSTKFWQAVKRREPKCRELNAELRKAWRLVPSWMDI